MSEISLVLLAGVGAGVLNAIGGGGKFVALPALVAVGLPPVTANASSTIALVPGAVAGASACRREITLVGGASTRSLTVISMIGSGVGAGLMLALPAASFEAAVPWLLAFTTLLVAFGRHLSRWLGNALGRSIGMSSRAVLIGQFFLAVYGGYFGGAVGTMMLAVWSVGLGLDAAVSNPMRVTQLAAIYLAAAVPLLITSDALGYPVFLAAMLVGAAVGGYGGAHLARRLPDRMLRGLLVASAGTTTVLYFLRG